MTNHQISEGFSVGHKPAAARKARAIDSDFIASAEPTEGSARRARPSRKVLITTSNSSRRADRRVYRASKLLYRKLTTRPSAVGSAKIDRSIEAASGSGKPRNKSGSPDPTSLRMAKTISIVGRSEEHTSELHHLGISYA